MGKKENSDTFLIKMGELIFAATKRDRAAFEQAVEMASSALKQIGSDPKTAKGRVIAQVAVMRGVFSNKTFKKSDSAVRAAGLMVLVGDDADGDKPQIDIGGVVSWITGGGATPGAGSKVCSDAIDALERAVENANAAQNAYYACLRASLGGVGSGGISQVAGIDEDSRDAPDVEPLLDCSSLLSRWGELGDALDTARNNANMACGDP